MTLIILTYTNICIHIQTAVSNGRIVQKLRNRVDTKNSTNTHTHTYTGTHLTLKELALLVVDVLLSAQG